MDGDSNKFSSESETATPVATPKTPGSAMFEDSKFFGSSFNIDNMSDEYLKAGGLSAKGESLLH
jgi:hypothetical protein